jgi:hypothetical protein
MEAVPLSCLPELPRNPNGGFQIAQNQVREISQSHASGRASPQYSVFGIITDNFGLFSDNFGLVAEDFGMIMENFF